MNVFPDDIDDDDDDLRDLSNVSFQRTIAEHSYAGHPMDERTATVCDLRQCFLEMLGTVSAVAFDLLCVFCFCFSLGIESGSSRLQPKLFQC